MRFRWPLDTVFSQVILDVEGQRCVQCGGRLHIGSHRNRRIHTLRGPLELCCRLKRCADPACPSRPGLVNPTAEASFALPGWLIGWDVFCFIGHRRFARHWSVPQIKDELADSYRVRLSDDAICLYLRRYQAMLAARQRDPELLRLAYRGVAALWLSIDGLQPEKGHETLYAVRELGAGRVWFAEALLSSNADEVRRLLARARGMAEALGKPVQLWLSDKQDAFVKGIAAEFPGVPHRFCSNHFLRDLAKPTLELDSHAKVQMRKKVRGLRAVERQAMRDRPPAGGTAGQVVLDYCSAVRGILNDDQGGPLRPPGQRMAEALSEVRASLGRVLALGKTGSAHGQLARLADRIDAGLAASRSQQAQVKEQTEAIAVVAGTLASETGGLPQRWERYQQLARGHETQGGEFHGRLAKVMRNWQAGLFVAVEGAGAEAAPGDNLELERWFRLPKGHERRIHGHRHAGVRIVQEGPSLLLALDAHAVHPGPFTAQDLLPYRNAEEPADQIQAVSRRKVMRKARSPKNGRFSLPR
ncbi:MAG: hypothetical protein LC749_13980 [Actinobacteria bacterium]|nr:hypothetical protein [Actinomycetota bacterium]